MASSTEESAGGNLSREAQVTRKVFNRLIWFLFVAMLAMTLDRGNIAFAALSMNKALGLSATAFGLATTFYSLGFVAAEIPSNMALSRFGARLWIARIMITWGLASTATMLVTGATSLYALRVLLGLAEGGFFPGVILYISYWFPERHRARATGLVLLAQPISMVLGAPLSGRILDMGGTLGLEGWRWLFLIEGIPSIILGVFAFLWLTDRPAKAGWLTQDERTVLERSIQSQELPRPDRSSATLWRELRSRTLLLLCLGYIGIPMSLGTFALWSPQIVRAALSAGSSFSYVGWVTAIPALCACVFMVYWTARSDRHRERTGHLIAAVLLTAAGWLVLVASRGAAAQVGGLCLAAMGAFASQSLYYPFATGLLSPRARPIGLAAVSASAVLGASISPIIVGVLKDVTGSFAGGILVSTGMLLVTSALAFAVTKITVNSSSVPTSVPSS